MLAALFAALPAWAATLQVVVAGVRNSTGQVLVAVCTEHSFLGESCAYNGRAPAHKGETLVTLDVPPGTWAVQAFHDEDGNDAVTMNAFGLPVEGLGFSNDAPFRFAAPSYRDAAFRLGPQGGKIRLSLRYLF